MNVFHSVSELMDEARFWQIINQSLAEAEAAHEYGDEQQDAQVAALTDALMALDRQEIAAFENRFYQLHWFSYRQDLWCAAYLMCGGCSDDGFDYFRYWLVSRGEAVFQTALAKPDSLADYPFVTADNDYYEFEAIAAVANDVFAEKFGGELYEYTAFRTEIPQMEFEWSDEDPESMKRICPKLFAKFKEQCF
ncbi:Uncharacterised protein [Kingella potus]|uniref:DUF4240 domain-containing protein n=1 Tax=Kingella potus TaxID=265175 RepID=A0A377R583_9NEIS|nr:DUF4240 domain-containing protein [Kingella potus]UOO99885.1 DUF4240 domain-containing protein [Kingella potus]STR03142.1 Uncharacterised protein [Kingella potus]